SCISGHGVLRPVETALHSLHHIGEFLLTDSPKPAILSPRSEPVSINFLRVSDPLSGASNTPSAPPMAAPAINPINTFEVLLIMFEFLKVHIYSQKIL